MTTVYFRFVARGSPPLQRSPLLERLIARASTGAGVGNWRAEAFELVTPPGTPMPAVGVAAWLGAGAAAQGVVGEWACVATPVHLSAGMTQVTFPADGILQLELAEAAALAADFNAVFNGAGLRLVPAKSGVLTGVFAQALAVVTHDPETVVGEDVYAFQPSGSDAPRLRRLMSEIEMWLFDHSVNRQRVARAVLPITGLWLWGGGATGAALPASVWAAGRDPFFAGFGDAPALSCEFGSGVVVLRDYPGSSTWAEAERRWLEPALAELRAGRIGRLHLSAGQRRFTMTPGVNLRFWRRTRPWWESFDMSDGQRSEQ